MQISLDTAYSASDNLGSKKTTADKITQTIRKLPNSEEASVWIFGGSKVHSVVFTVEREMRKQTYTFKMYNKGDGYQLDNDTSKKLHPGNLISFTESPQKEEQEVYKIRCCATIKNIRKDQLSSKFWQELLENTEQDTMGLVYDAIKNHLLAESSEAYVAAPTKPGDFQQAQKYGTCAITQIQTVFKDVLSKQAYRAFKAYEIKYLMSQVNDPELRLKSKQTLQHLETIDFDLDRKKRITNVHWVNVDQRVAGFLHKSIYPGIPGTTTEKN